jgi:hypothetical protein
MIIRGTEDVHLYIPAAAVAAKISDSELSIQNNPGTMQLQCGPMHFNAIYGTQFNLFPSPFPPFPFSSSPFPPALEVPLPTALHVASLVEQGSGGFLPWEIF